MTEQSEIPQVIEVGPEKTAHTYDAFCELRKGLPVMETRDGFVRWVNEKQRPQEYRVAGVFLPSSQEAVAVAGFRAQYMLSRGHVLYVDDLVTLPEHRSKGYAELLFEWLVEEARRLQCGRLHLDSGYQRNAAHRFYLKRGMDLNAHHFSLVIR